MGAGRRTETFNVNGHPGGEGVNYKPAPQRKLAERNRLGSVVFGCTIETYKECVVNKLFGLPYTHISYVEHIQPGMPLFLFNYNDRKMHGIFEAVSQGALNISPYAWTKEDGARTQFPAQVRVLLRADFSRIVSLSESVFKEILIDSYYDSNRFFFELDNEQTDRLIRVFERVAGDSYRAVAPPKSSTPAMANAWQTVSSGKVWKKANGSGRSSDDNLKLKNPATVVISEHQRGAQYFPSSSSKEVMPEEEVVASHQQHVWSTTRRSSNGEEYSSDEEESEDLPTSYKAPEVNTEAEMRRMSSNEKPEQEPGMQMKTANGYRPQLISGTASELQPSTSEEVPTVGTDLTEAEHEEKLRVLNRLINITETQQSGVQSRREGEIRSESINRLISITETQQPVVHPWREGEVRSGSSTGGNAEWERLARDESLQEQALLKEERERLEATLSDLDSSVAMTVTKNLELYGRAVEQMRQDGMELRRLLDEARMQSEEHARLRAIENSHAAMAAEMQALKLEVVDLRKQLGKSATQEKFERLHENGGTQLSIVEPVKQTAPDIYLIGGLGDQMSRLESVMVWSPATDRLRIAAPMLTPRYCAGASVLDEQIYVFGGGDGSSWYDTVERYDRRKDQWLPCAPMKTKRGSLGGVTLGDRIFAVGGGNGQLSFSKVESYDPYLGAWLPCTSMLEKRFCVAATETGGAVYALGGFDGEQYLMSMERFDPREALWTRMPSMTAKRGSLSTTVLNGKIYALGGYDGEGILDVVETFDPRAGRWDMGLQMCCKRAYGAVAVVGEAMYYMGGLAEEEVVDSIQRFTEAAGWQSMRPRVIGKRSCLAAIIL